MKQDVQLRALRFLRGNKLPLHCQSEKMYNMTVGLRLKAAAQRHHIVE